jgi:hypothetical protein
MFAARHARVYGKNILTTLFETEIFSLVWVQYTLLGDRPQKWPATNKKPGKKSPGSYLLKQKSSVEFREGVNDPPVAFFNIFHAVGE